MYMKTFQRIARSVARRITCSKFFTVMQNVEEKVLRDCSQTPPESFSFPFVSFKLITRKEIRWKIKVRTLSMFLLILCVISQLDRLNMFSRP